MAEPQLRDEATRDRIRAFEEFLECVTSSPLRESLNTNGFSVLVCMVHNSQLVQLD